MPKATYIKDEATLLAEVGKTKTATILKQADPKLLNDKEFMKKAVAINPYAIKYIGKAISETKWGGYDRDNYCEFFAVNGMSYRYAPVEVKNEPRSAFVSISNTLDVVPFLTKLVVRYLCESYKEEILTAEYFGKHLNSVFAHNPDSEYSKNKNVAIFASQYYSFGFQDLAQYHYADDEDVVRVALKTNGDNFEFISDRLKGNLELAKMAIMNGKDIVDSESLSKCRSAIMSDRKFVKKYLKQSESPVLPEEYADDEEMATLAVKADSDNYYILSDRLKSDFNLAKTAFTADGYLLEDAPDAIKDNNELVKITVQSTEGLAFAYASSRLKKDWSFIKELLVNAKNDAERMDIMAEVDKSILSTKEAIDYLVSAFNNGENFFDYVATDSYDKEFILDFVEAVGEISSGESFAVLSYLPEDAQDNETIVSTCVGNNPEEFMYASERLLSDKDFILNLMTTLDVDLYEYIDDELQSDNEILKLHKKFELKRKYF